jgi:hypothetical protein
MRESKIEKDVSDYAKGKGWLVYKFCSPGNRAVPDKIFMRKGKMFFIEFKAPGKKPTKLQEKVGGRIGDQNFCVYYIDSIKEGKWVVDVHSEVTFSGF